jgi:hypothetical protein
MFRKTWCASVETELSNALAAWTCDSRETPSHAETDVLDSSANQNCTPPSVYKSAREILAQRSQGVVFFCHSLGVAVSKDDRVASERLEVSGIRLRTELPEFSSYIDEPIF